MSIRLLLLTGFAAVTAVPATLGAQEPKPAEPRIRTRVYTWPGEPEVAQNRLRTILQRRARLGVTVDMDAVENDSIGATIQAVTPGGPASKAGIRSGDIITKLNGKSLTASDNTRRGEDESLPAVRLVELASQLKPNDTITVEYRRGDARRTTQLVTGDEPVMAFERFPDMPELRFDGPETAMLKRMPGEPEKAGGFGFGKTPGGAMAYAFSMGGPLMDLELAPINPDLGQYFGTTEGVLVISVPKESTLGLKGGDVILSVDGRKPSGPGNLLRILRSYNPGDSFKLEILRNKSRTTVMGKLNMGRDE
jgi:membrane-associated protease RseP (regulator of RpoE activity)